MTDSEDFSNPTEKKKGKGKLFIILGLILLLAGAGGYLFLFQPTMIGLGSSTDSMTEVSTSTNASENAYSNIIPLDEIIINIRDQSFQRLFKLTLSLELLNTSDNPTVQRNVPILLDSFQSHLRGLRIAEIEGSRAIYRIKEELISRANIILHPVRIKNILFSELLIQ